METNLPILNFEFQQDLIFSWPKLFLILAKYMQKQPFIGVIRKKCSENMEQIYRGTPMPECDFNKVALNLWKADSVFKQ